MREGREVGRGSAVKVKETQISSRRSTIKKKELSRGPSIRVQALHHTIIRHASVTRKISRVRRYLIILFVLLMSRMAHTWK